MENNERSQNGRIAAIVTDPTITGVTGVTILTAKSEYKDKKFFETEDLNVLDKIKMFKVGDDVQIKTDTNWLRMYDIVAKVPNAGYGGKAYDPLAAEQRRKLDCYLAMATVVGEIYRSRVDPTKPIEPAMLDDIFKTHTYLSAKLFNQIKGTHEATSNAPQQETPQVTSF